MASLYVSLKNNMIVHEVNYSSGMPYVSSYFYCHIQPEGLWHHHVTVLPIARSVVQLCIIAVTHSQCCRIISPTSDMIVCSVCMCWCQEYARGGSVVENWTVPAVVYSLISRWLRDGVSLLLTSFWFAWWTGFYTYDFSPQWIHNKMSFSCFWCFEVWNCRLGIKNGMQLVKNPTATMSNGLRWGTQYNVVTAEK